MTNKRKLIIKIIAAAIALSMPFTTGIVTTAANKNSVKSESDDTNLKYDSPDINKLTGHGKEPEDLSVSAGAKYLEKAWYEYVTYSDKAVSSYRLDDDYRLLFYDPYTYTNAMVMEVKFDAATSEFDTMSSYTISKTNSKSISSCVSSTQTNTSATQTSGKDVTHSNVENKGNTKTIYNHSIDDYTTGTVKEYTDYSYVLKTSESSSIEAGVTSSLITESKTIIGSEAGGEAGFEGPVPTGNATFNAFASEEITVGSDIGASTTTSNTSNSEWYTDRETNTTEYSDGYKTTTEYTGSDTVEYNTTSTTDGWTELSARVTKTLGSSKSTSSSWSEEESTTVTKTYAATHFASDGVTPLPWAIVHYEVQMPMKVCMQAKYSGEWVTISTTYCMLTTVKGTCRAWMQNGQVYYEDWGSGEPVVATDFWSQFMTKEQIMKVYQNKLYPVGGDD